MKKADLLAACIDEILAGRSSLDRCETRHPELSGELRSLLGVASRIRPAEVTPSTEFQARVRTHLLEQYRHTRHSPFDMFRFGHPKLFRLVSALSGSFVIVASLGGTAYAAQNSLPDDTLYPVKRSIEKARLLITATVESKANLHLRFAGERIEEVIDQAAQGRPVSATAVQNAATQLDAAIQDVRDLEDERALAFTSRLDTLTQQQQTALNGALKEVPDHSQQSLKYALETVENANLIATTAAANPTFLHDAPSVSDSELGSSRFEIEGVLVSAEGRGWNVGGVLLNNVYSSRTVSFVGQHIKLEGITRGKQTFVNEVTAASGGDGFRLQGVFKGTVGDAAAWNVSGLLLPAPTMTQPKKGSRVTLTGTVRDGIATITAVKNAGEVEEHETGGIEPSASSSPATVTTTTSQPAQSSDRTETENTSEASGSSSWGESDNTPEYEHSSTNPLYDD